MIRGAKKIAEYAIRKWMEYQHFIASNFKVTMNGNESVIEDAHGDTREVIYDGKAKSVYVK